MSHVLRLSADLSLPLDAVTQTFLVVGKRGSGKSNTAARFVEQLHRARLPFVVLDPVDTWWGLKAGLDGRRGLDVYVFGGRKQDLPLNETDGALIADVLCEHRVSMVLSVKHLSGRARSRFMVAFAQKLFQQWGGGPLHLVLEEAHELAPQMGGSRTNDTDGDAAMLGAFKRLWKLGRSSGIGGTAVTQRPASLSKDITTQSEILIAHRTIGPQDVKAIGEWVKYHGQHESILADLPTLPTGEAFVWAPEFPEAAPIGLKRTTVLRRETFDSASTPKVGEQRVEPKELAVVDLERLRSKMAATIEKAKQDDPKELRKQLIEKDRRIKELEKARPISAVLQSGKAMPVLTDADRELLKALRDEYLTFSENISAKADAMLTSLAGRAKASIDDALKAWTDNIDRRRELFATRLEGARVQRLIDKLQRVEVPHATGRVIPTTPGRPPAAPPRATRSAPAVASGDVVEPGRRILGALAWLLAAGIEQPTRHQVAFLARYTVNGHFNNTLGNLRTSGHVDYPSGGLVALTETGRASIAITWSAPDRQAMVEQVLAVLRDEPARRLFTLIAQAHGPMTREDLASQAGYTVNGHFNNTLGHLRALGVIDYPQRGTAALSRSMFDGLS